MDIVSWTFDSGTYDQDKPLYIDSSNPKRCLSARQTRTLVRKLVSGFNAHGLQKGDCVCVVSFNDIHYTSLYLGIIGSGGCFTGGNPGYTAHELAHHLRITGAKFILTSLKTLDAATTAAKECGIPQSKIFVLGFHGEVVPEGRQSWTKLLLCGEKDWVKVKDPNNTSAAFVSTSGTSGLPKAAIIPHSYLRFQGEFQDQISSVRHKISHLIAVPPFHVFTIPAQHAQPLRRGSPCYIMPRFEEQSFLTALETFQITQTVVVPPILMSLSKCLDPNKLKSLRRIFVGGSCATDGMQQQLYAKLSPKARIAQVYGMTEAGWATMWQSRNIDITGSVGRALPGSQLRLVDKDGQIITKDGVNGEIHIHSPHPMKGYLNNPIATAEAFTEDGWVRSGDVGFVRDGQFYVIDRTKDLIKVRGWQVSPAEIEASLLEHPDIIDAAVIGMPAKDGCGEVPQGFIVRKDGSHLEEKDIKLFLGVRLARYKGVEDVQFVDKIPRNPTGKILRRILRDSRRAQSVAPDQVVASAYSNAIKGLEKSQLEKSQQERNPEQGSETQSLLGGLLEVLIADGGKVFATPRRESRHEPLAIDMSRPGHRRTESQDSCLTDASTIDSLGPSTPPRIEELVETTRIGRKRKGDLISPSTVKRRSARIGMLRVRAT